MATHREQEEHLGELALAEEVRQVLHGVGAQARDVLVRCPSLCFTLPPKRNCAGALGDNDEEEMMMISMLPYAAYGIITAAQ